MAVEIVVAERQNTRLVVIATKDTDDENLVLVVDGTSQPGTFTLTGLGYVYFHTDGGTGVPGLSSGTHLVSINYDANLVATATIALQTTISAESGTYGGTGFGKRAFGTGGPTTVPTSWDLAGSDVASGSGTAAFALSFHISGTDTATGYGYADLTLASGLPPEEQPGGGPAGTFSPPVLTGHSLAPASPSMIRDNPIGTRLLRHFRGTPIGVNVFKLVDGTMTLEQPANADEIEKVFFGGHEPEPITTDEREALIAAGLGSGVND